MKIAKTWVFPIITVIAWLLIAAALVKVAFFPNTDTQNGADVKPTASLTPPTINPQLGTVVNKIEVSGQIAQDTAQTAKTTSTGTVTKIYAPKTTVVAAGAKLFDVRDRENDKTVTITSPVAGTVVDVKAILKQSINTGDEIMRIQPATFNVSGTLTPEQQYRLLTIPAEAEITIPNGPAPFTCTGLTVQVSSANDSTKDTGAMPTATPGATLKCQVPADVRVFPGLQATMAVAGGQAENVLTIPTTATQGSADKGKVWLADRNGNPGETREITLGLSDGKTVEVKNGLTENDTILQFAPGSPEELQKDGMSGEMGEMGEMPSAATMEG